MVEKKSRCYHLSESLPLKYVALCSKNGTWFLRTVVHLKRIPDQCESLKRTRYEVNKNYYCAANAVRFRDTSMGAKKKRLKCKIKEAGIKRCLGLKTALPRAIVCSQKRKEKRREKKAKRQHRICQQNGLKIEKESQCPTKLASRNEVNWIEKSDANMIVEARSEVFSESVSVSGIMMKYFSDYDEVASGSRFPLATVRDRHKKGYMDRANSEASGEKCTRRPEVGRRVLQALDGLGLTPCRRQSSVSLCQNSDKKLWLDRADAVVRNLAFEITQELGRRT